MARQECAQISSVSCDSVHGSLCPTKVQTDVAESLGMGTGLLVIEADRETPLCVGCGDLKACDLCNALVSGSVAKYVVKGVE